MARDWEERMAPYRVGEAEVVETKPRALKVDVSGVVMGQWVPRSVIHSRSKITSTASLNVAGHPVLMHETGVLTVQTWWAQQQTHWIKPKR